MTLELGADQGGGCTPYTSEASEVEIDSGGVLLEDRRTSQERMRDHFLETKTALLLAGTLVLVVVLWLAGCGWMCVCVCVRLCACACMSVRVNMCVSVCMCGCI